MPPIFREDLKLYADKSFEDLSAHLYSILGIIAEQNLNQKEDEIFDVIRKDPESKIEDEFGPLTPFDAVRKTFRAALIHVDLAGKARHEGNLEVAWARLAFASQLIGRIQRAEEIETAARKQTKLTYDLKIKTIELVSCLRPEGGWATHEAAYKAIEPELAEYRQSLIAEDDEERKSKEVDIFQQLQRWRKEDHLVGAAFRGNSAKTKAERAKKMGK